VGQYSRFFGCSQKAFSAKNEKREKIMIQNIFLLQFKLNIFIYSLLYAENMPHKICDIIKYHNFSQSAYM
jgi:hypothetical protein